MRLDGVDGQALTAASFILDGPTAAGGQVAEAALPTGETAVRVAEPTLFDTEGDGFLLGAGGPHPALPHLDVFDDVATTRESRLKGGGTESMSITLSEDCDLWDPDDDGYLFG